MTKKQQVKELIINHMKALKWASYTQLLNVLASAGIETKGNFVLGDDEKNIQYWGGLSKTVTEALVELLNEGKIINTPAPVDLYKMEGLVIGVPLVFNIPAQKLPQPAALLSVIRYVEPAVEIQQ